MIFRLLRPNPSIGTIQGLYGAIVAQARLPSFYLRYGVPDTVDGRFDLIVLHLFLVVERLGQGEGTEARLAQPLIEAFCRDLDDNMRGMGVSDLAVPRRMRGYMEAYYGRTTAYRAALASGGTLACAQALARNVFGDAAPADGARLLADYMVRAAQALGAVAVASLAHGELRFPDPETIPAMSHG